MADKPVSKRSLAETHSFCPTTAPRKPANHNTKSSLVQGGKRPWRSPARQLPAGFMHAVADAFMSHATISERVHRIHFVLDSFGQPADVLPTKVRRFIDRFDSTGGVR